MADARVGELGGVCGAFEFHCTAQILPSNTDSSAASENGNRS